MPEAFQNHVPYSTTLLQMHTGIAFAYSVSALSFGYMPLTKPQMPLRSQFRAQGSSIKKLTIIN